MKKLIPTIGAITGLLIGMPCLNAGGPELKIERSVKVSFDSEVGKSYNAYSTTDVAKQKWELLGGPVGGGGEKIVFFYQSDDDQKVFFKVEETEAKVSSTKDFEGFTLQFENYLKLQIDDFNLLMFSMFQGTEPLVQIESKKDGKAEMELVTVPDLKFVGDIALDGTTLIFKHSLNGNEVVYDIMLIPASYNAEYSYWSGSYAYFKDGIPNHGTFWLGLDLFDD